MFSSNPFPSPIHGLPPFSGEEKDGVFFNHHPINFPGEYSNSFHHLATPFPVKETTGFQNNKNNHHDHVIINKLSDSVITPSRKRVAASKKDRHSKIFTAQGPRDRRVRLSIDISKKFFGLQDLLGFDKASKTLDWLFTRSMAAIKDLVQEKKHTSSSNLSEQCEQVFMEKGPDNNYLVKINERKKKTVSKRVMNGGKRKKKTTQKHKSGLFQVNLAARSQLRAEARSRARERTMEKLRIKKLDIDAKNINVVAADCNIHCYLDHQIQSQNNDHEVKIGESLTQQKLLPKPYSLLYNSQQKYVDSKDSTS
uniref:Cycloidea-like protein n=1 Tax=Tagetes patula TaxID=55843 RepID=A0A346D3S2_TAGPA|nr:cycloidea-like protein [Tagetes patula]